MASRSRENIIALAGFLALAIIYLWPLPLHWGTFIPGDNGDSVPNLWPFWYFPWSIAQGHGIAFHTGLQFAPDGINLIYASNSAVGALAMSVVSLLWSPAAALNGWLLLHLWLGGWFFFRFCRELGAGRLGSFLGGLAFSWSPFVAVHLPGHYTLVQIAYTSGALWALAVLARRSRLPNPLHARSAIAGLAISCWAVTATDFYLAVMTLFLLIALMAHLALVHGRVLVRSRALWMRAALVAVLTIIGLSPWVWFMVQARTGGDYAAIDPGFGSRNVATWSRLVTLPAYHFLWGPRIYPEFIGKLSSFNEYTYLGMVSLALAFIGMLYVQQWRRVVAWIAAFLLALGFAGANRYSMEPAWPTGPLSFGRWWPIIFPLSEFRVPGRWQFALCAALAVCLAFGSDALLGRIQWRSRRWIVAVVFFAAMVFDLLRWPLPIFEAQPIDAGISPATSTHGKTVLDVPVGIISGQGHSLGDFRRETLLRQMVHGRPVLSANVSRLPNDAVARRKADLATWLSIQGGEIGTTTPEALGKFSEQDWSAFRQRYDIGSIRIPVDWPTSAALQQICNKMGLWEWRKTGAAMIANPDQP